MKKYLFILAFLLFSASLYSQTFDNTFDRYSRKYVSERVHLHFDKSTYGAGDTIWFKAYILKGVEPAIESKNLYIDWTNDSGKLIHRSISPIAAGVTFGQTAIPQDYHSGFIHIKAYTKWMLNFDSSFLFNRDIRVLSQNDVARNQEKNITTLKVFPEGGNLVMGVTNKIAFKASDQFGRPVEIKGELLEDGNKKENLTVLHDGMGLFYVRPVPGRTYSISWTDNTGKQGVTPLPGAMDDGVNMQIGWMKDKRAFLVTGAGKYSSGVIRIIGTMYHQPVFNIVREFKDGVVQGVIPVSSLPSGVLAITVLDQEYHPLSERITFINNGEYHFDADMQVAHWGLNKRARNEIEISIPDSLYANLSVSVTDAHIDFDTTNTIISDLLLSSEIKGRVYNPAFYFRNGSDSAQKLLDLVMLTNGWRKISWTALASGILPQIKYPADTAYMTVSGKIYGATPMQLQNAGDLVLIVTQKRNSEWLMAPIQPDGSFKVNNFMLFDTASVYYQPPKGKGLRDVSVQFMGNPLPVSDRIAAGKEYFVNNDTTGLGRHFMLSKAMLDELKFFQGKVLEEVKITARTKSAQQILDEKYTSGMFAGGDANTFDIRDDPSASASVDIFSYLQGRVAGLIITPGNPPTVSRRGATPALFLNEMPVDAEVISQVPVANIAYVKVIRPPFMGAVGGGAGGAIAIYTRKGGDMESEPGKGLSKNTITGYSVIRQFYSPDYEMTSNDQKDLRTTLYWNPEISLNPAHRQETLKFFNNDVTQSFRIVIEGMTPDGKLTRIVKIME